MLINPSVCCRDEYREYDRRCHIAGITSISIKDKDGKLVGDVKSDEELPYRVGYMDDGSAIMDKDGLSDKAVKQWYYPEYAKSNCTIVFSMEAGIQVDLAAGDVVPSGVSFGMFGEVYLSYVYANTEDILRSNGE